MWIPCGYINRSDTVNEQDYGGGTLEYGVSTFQILLLLLLLFIIANRVLPGGSGTTITRHK
jgi:hypothetical protein